MRQRLVAMVRLGLRSRAFARHVLQKLGTLTVGAVFVSEPVRRLRARLDAAPGAPLPLRLAIVAHAYYPDLLGEVLACRAVLPPGTPVFVTVPPERMAAAEAAVAGAGAVTLIAAENRGRDIAPLVAVLRSGVLDGFDAVLKIHTKRSPHLLDGETRRKLLFDRLCGSRRGTRRALSAFLDPQTGMVGWAACWRFEPPYWMGNRARIAALAQCLGLAGPPPLGFFEGSMFWFRPAALAALDDLALVPADFEAEAGQVDGTLHHAIERLFTIAAWARGYRVRDLRGRELEGSLGPPG